MLGGSESQVVAIDKAKELGYFTVLCDYLPNNPGQHHADSFHLVSTTDKEAVLRVAREEGVDGVVAYGSDPAAPTAAYVAEQLGLPGIPYQTALNFCEKHLFRSFLEENGFDVPRHRSVRVGDADDALRAMRELTFPIVIKPTDSSGSKGVTIVRGEAEAPDAFAYATKYSRNGILEVEEYIQACHEGVIEGEIFVYDGEIVSWGLMNCLRDNDVNPLLPAGYCHPLAQSPRQIQIVRDAVAQLVRVSGITCGALNIEMLLTADDRLFFLDAGPRNGGNMLPVFYSRISGDDIIAGTIKTAMGDPWEHHQFDGAKDCVWYEHVLHATEQGTFDHVAYSPQVRAAMVFESVYVTPGEHVSPFLTSDRLLGLLMMRFDTRAQLDEVLADLPTHIRVVLRDGADD